MPTFAAVDVGSNSVRLKIARLQGGRLRAFHEDREVTRLGEGVFRLRISHSRIDGRDGQSIAPLSSRHAADCHGHGARGCHQRVARRAQFAGISGVGALGNGLAG